MTVLFPLLSIGFQVYEFMLVFRIILSWLPHDNNHPLVDWLYRLTDPYLSLFRNLPLQYNGIDFSPILALFVLGMIKQVLFQLIM